MPISVAQNEMDQLTADAVKAYMATDTLKLWGFSVMPSSSEAIAFAATPAGVDPDLYNSTAHTLGTVAQLVVAGQGTTWSLPVTGLNILNRAAVGKQVYAVLLVNLTRSKSMYLLKFDTPFFLAANATLPVDLTLWFNTAPYS